MTYSVPPSSGLKFSTRLGLWLGLGIETGECEGRERDDHLNITLTRSTDYAAILSQIRAKVSVRVRVRVRVRVSVRVRVKGGVRVRVRVRVRG
jgi:hypothetical protein